MGVGTDKAIKAWMPAFAGMTGLMAMAGNEQKFLRPAAAAGIFSNRRILAFLTGVASRNTP